jgi:chromosome segregation ATPase
LDLEQKLTKQLTLLKADMALEQSLRQEISELRKAKAVIEERCLSKDWKLSELNGDITGLRDFQISMNDKLAQRELQLIERASVTSDDLVQMKEELQETNRKLQAADEAGATMESEIEDLKGMIKTKEDMITSVTRQKEEFERKVRAFAHVRL